MNDIDRLYPQAEGAPGRLQLSGQRKPKALIALQRAEADAWAEVTRLADVMEAVRDGDVARRVQGEMNAAVRFAHKAQQAASAAYADFFRDPDAWWGAEDAEDTREAGSL